MGYSYLPEFLDSGAWGFLLFLFLCAKFMFWGGWLAYERITMNSADGGGAWGLRSTDFVMPTFVINHDSRQFLSGYELLKRKMKKKRKY